MQISFGMDNQTQLEAVTAKKPRQSKLGDEKTAKTREPEKRPPSADDDSLMFLPIG